MQKNSKRYNPFTSERLVLLVIFVNTVILFMQESGVHSATLNLLDALCTVFFIVEMVCKHFEYGVKGYWASNWNRLDGTLVILSLPALLSYFVPTALANLSTLLVLRVLRVFRIFRVVHIFPNFSQTMKGLWRALRTSLPVFLGFFVLVIMVALLNCAIFRDLAPQFFGSPLDAIYSTFRLCTVEGWYEIPDAICQGRSTWMVVFVRIYFVFILVSGGIIGLSLVNSIFVDAMVEDNNKDLEDDVKRLESKIDALAEALKARDVQKDPGDGQS